MACSHAATMNDDEFELNDDTGEVMPKNKKWNFMKKVEDNLDLKDKIQLDRFNEMKRMIMEQMKKTIKNKSDSRGEKRSSEENDPAKVLSKPRIKSPPKI